MKKEIVHFSHEHPLTPCGMHQIRHCCVICGGNISPNVSYGCSKCADNPEVPDDRFFIHESCAKQPPQTIHPLHPQPNHRLSLSRFPSHDQNFICSACGGSECGVFVFLCCECRFQLHFHCAFLIPVSTNNYDYEDSQQQQQQQQQQRLGQTHDRFILCKKGSDLADKISCSACNQPFEKEESIHVCLERKLTLHKSCIDLPLQTQHPFHPQHPLTLLSLLTIVYYACGPGLLCNACGLSIFVGNYMFYCSQCNFYLHITCASLIPVNFSYDDDLQHEHRIEYINQTHPLIVCNKKEKNFNFNCSGCALPIIEDLIFVCLECKLLLHKSCTQLPQKIIHAFHPKHPLILTPQELPYYGLCKACKNDLGSLAYQCYECDYKIGIKCASSTYIVPTKYEFHQHPLVFFNKTTYLLSCSVCDLKFYTPFVGCIECEFRVHVHCIPNLPSTIKHKCHRHPLTFTKSPIKDRYDEDEDEDEDGDGDEDSLMYYCDACEERRRPADATYYSTECLYVAHVNCVISQVLPSLKEDSHLACKLGDTKLDTPPNAIDENTNTMDNRDAMTNMELEGEAMLESVTGADDAKAKQALMEESTSVTQLIISKNGGNEVPANPTIAQLDIEISKLNGRVLTLKYHTRELEQRRANLVSSTK